MLKLNRLDNTISDILSRHLQQRFKFEKTDCFMNHNNKFVYDINDDKITNDPVANSIVKLALREFTNHGMYVKQNCGYIIYENYEEQKEEKEEYKKIKCDNDEYYFEKYDICMFILHVKNDKNVFAIYPKYQDEHIKFPIFQTCCGVEMKETVEQLQVENNMIIVFDGDLYYQDFSDKKDLMRITVKMVNN